MKSPKASLEQWLAFQAVVDEGGFAQAAAKLHKSQSTVSYAVTKLQDMLGIILFEIQGRKAILTEAGKQLLNRSRHLTRLAREVEHSAHNLQQGWEKSLRLMIDGIFPRQKLLSVLSQFNRENTHTRLIIKEGVLSGPTEALTHNLADIVITSKIPAGYVGEKLMDIDSVPYAHIDNPLHQRPQPLTPEDLQTERYIIVMDSGSQQPRDEGWLGSEFHWKVDSLQLKIELVAQGIGFSWLPRQWIEERQLPLKALQFDQDVTRKHPLYLVRQNTEEVGPSCLQLMALFRSIC